MFQVPSQFLKVAEASLREFFSAIKAGKDNDPAWKKVIYKVICKLDFDIPEIFKSPSVLDRLHEIRDWTTNVRVFIPPIIISLPPDLTRFFKILCII